ncbi:hypothetical protein OOT46_27945 [Aquabacterium sp. A7-Y]|uniref:hypothetical protein n=1 Tax=Aquabacterium sp. A7-Y TaxID=1349605 RepID=UPI00223D980E|nr:hypothetical protein [Aquabacterium sp. A7-Y]MCW7541637.1 hypothetical protein [Aquabacterium sp. A7-Y]
MQKKTPLGRNKTGIQMSPVDAARMQAGSEAAMLPDQDALDAPPPLVDTSYASVRQGYMREDEGLGSVPPPGTQKGLLKSGADMITGTRPQVLVDKLGERLAFERGGVRLYDSLLVKCSAAAHPLPDATLTRCGASATRRPATS